jgi:SAM-dependent methyltransferase
MSDTAARSAHHLLSAALRGHRCDIVGADDGTRPLPVHAWLGTADESDAVVLRHCVGRTLDVGCGPGRMAEALVRAGHEVLALDVAAEAVLQTRTRGVTAHRQDVFAPVADEGTWETALLADGNIGIGGDPVALLQRLRELLVPGGRVVVDLDPPGVGVVTSWSRLRIASGVSRPFLWTVVAAEELGAIASEAGYDAWPALEHEGRWFGVLECR